LPLFEYSGFDAAGKKVSGMIEATGRRSVLQKLRSQGIYPSSLREESAAPTRERRLGALRWVGKKVPVIELAAATRQLATLLGAGLPLDEALSTIVGQLEQPVLARSLGRVREEVIQGEALHTSLAKQGRIFPPLFVNMVQVGENTGTLDKVLQRLADFLEEQARMKSRINSAMAYPILMALVGTGVLGFLLTFVVPKVTRMIQDLGQSLPLPTLILIRSTDFMTRYWWLIALILVGAGLALARHVRTEQGRLTLDRLALKVPLFGRLNLLIATSRFSRTLATLLQSGVPLLNALDISQNLMQNRILRQALEDTAVAVREGESLADPLRRSGVFPPMLAQMSAIGERSGELEKMLFRVAEAYEHQVEMSLAGLLSLLEPLMILVMGTVVGFIVMAILLPIFQASSGMG
jgi:general secretion pathway protein F